MLDALLSNLLQHFQHSLHPLHPQDELQTSTSEEKLVLFYKVCIIFTGQGFLILRLSFI